MSTTNNFTFLEFVYVHFHPHTLTQISNANKQNSYAFQHDVLRATKYKCTHTINVNTMYYNMLCNKNKISISIIILISYSLNNETTRKFINIIIIE